MVKEVRDARCRMQDAEYVLSESEDQHEDEMGDGRVAASTRDRSCYARSKIRLGYMDRGFRFELEFIFHGFAFC